MLNKTFKKKYFSLNSIVSDLKNVSEGLKSNSGIIYTLYSDKLNLLEMGFASNNKIIDKKLLDNQFILLDKKPGLLSELILLRNTLNELGLKNIQNKYYNYSNLTIRYLNTLGWPIGKSIYKQRQIKKRVALN